MSPKPVSPQPAPILPWARASKASTCSFATGQARCAGGIQILQSRLCFKFGEDVDDESGLPHAAHIMATAAIVIDAQREGTLIDDRAHTPGLPAEMKRVAELKKRWPKAA